MIVTITVFFIAAIIYNPVWDLFHFQIWAYRSIPNFRLTGPAAANYIAGREIN